MLKANRTLYPISLAKDDYPVVEIDPDCRPIEAANCSWLDLRRFVKVCEGISCLKMSVIELVTRSEESSLRQELLMIPLPLIDDMLSYSVCVFIYSGRMNSDTSRGSLS